MFRLRFPVAQLAHWADKYEYNQGDGIPASIGRRARKRGSLTADELREIATWKSPRSAGRCARNGDEYIREVTRAALRSSEPRFKVEVLRLLDGVDWPTASVILHFCDKGDWPILDVRALWTLGATIPASTYSFALWEEYSRYTRELAQRTGSDMRTVDRALWAYSKLNQPTGAG